MRAILSVLLVFNLSFSPAVLGATTDSLCENEGNYLVGFFNGVWNIRSEATTSLAALKVQAGVEFNGERVEYELFYNSSGMNDGSGATMFQDLAEVFMQRAEEIEPDFEGRYELFWSAVSNDADGFLSKITAVAGGAFDFIVGSLSDLYTEITTEAAALISRMVSDPPTR